MNWVFFGRLLFERRRRAKMTQKELGAKVQRSDWTISAIEGGRINNISVMLLDRLALALGVTLVDLVKDLCPVVEIAKLSHKGRAEQQALLAREMRGERDE